jgi:hypothetical protein
MGRSKPRASKENLFLDMFVMKMKKNRLMNEVRIHEKKLKSLETALKVLNGEIAKVEGMVSRETPKPLKKEMQKGHVKGKTMKKIILNY